MWTKNVKRGVRGVDNGWDVCRGWTKACVGWLSRQNALLFPYASPSGKAEGSADKPLRKKEKSHTTYIRRDIDPKHTAT